MIRFLHSADWQLGARFRQFGAKGEVLRSVRLDSLRRSLELARTHTVDAFLVAGDLFEDNQVDETLVKKVVNLFSEFSSVQVFLLPGNHDPNTGPDAVWNRKSFLSAPSNVHVLRDAEVVDLGGAFLLSSPLHQKLSSIDPSLKIAELAATLPSNAIKIGITHGALAIEGKHQPNDFPIALNAASRADLDYLALGHWHNWLPETDNGRILMPGTPEPDHFDQDAGSVALVEIADPGAPPKIERHSVSSLCWKSLVLDFLSLESSRATLENAIKELDPGATVLRCTLRGSASPLKIGEQMKAMESLIHPFLVSQIRDETTVELSEMELLDLRSRHPILAQVLADINRMESLATGKSETLLPDTSPPLSLAEAQEILSGAKIDLAALPPSIFSMVRQLLLQTLQEVTE